jgi:hypothetical protein
MMTPTCTPNRVSRAWVWLDGWLDETSGASGLGHWNIVAHLLWVQLRLTDDVALPMMAIAQNTLRPLQPALANGATGATANVGEL